MKNSKDSNRTIDRRKFIFRTTQAVAGAAIATGAASASASSSSFIMDSETKSLCGTCQYWGGQRRISEDGKSIAIDSLGWCNNRKSPNFRKTTGPQTGPMKVWEKWTALSQS